MRKNVWIGVAGFVSVIAVLTVYLLVPGANYASGGALDNSVVGVIEGTEVDLAFKMGGTIADLRVKEGDVIQAGQLLAVLSNEDLLAKREQAEAAYELSKVKLGQAEQGVTVTNQTSDAQVQQAKAAVDAARAQYEAAKNGARPEEINQLQAKLEAAQTAEQTAQTNYQRMQHLLTEGAVPKAQVEEAQLQYEKATAERAAVQEQLSMAKSGARKEQIDAAKAQLNQAVAAYNQAVAAHGQVGIKQLYVQSAKAAVQQAKGALAEVEAHLNDTKLTAPLSGVVKSVNVHKGELVAQGYTVLTLQAQDELFAKFYVSENDLAGLEVGQSVALFVPSLGREVDGKLSVIAPAADFAVQKATQELGDRDIRSFQVQIDLQGAKLRPGLSVEWQIKGAGDK
ncbi:HlyD family efflux transporter periplasmic adaptor subunit [Brevibacillus humidisoli]|uniref:HlyD family secretion protein n=1 Tax=Brevibacillus humidisoli TaxID=2895522 RepID=UPI001E5402F6|nr:HlyD family efflux transporter periplasmic adaptor subunit [Brevibacillus humidisoli]UFJ40805.1 HlyD family efflux transporter periplasmic adaptor subunit [Brevibacillus humidisoli]